MAEFKKLSDVEVVETPMDTANVLIEEDGVIKKAPKSAVGTVKSVNGIEADENGNVAIETASSWNDLKDKPFYEETDFLPVQEETSVTLDEYGRGNYDGNWYPSSGSNYTVIWDGIEYEGTAYDDGDACGNLVISINGDNLRFFEGSTIIGASSMVGEHTFSINLINKTIQKIDEKYMPDSAVILSNATKGLLNISSVSNGIPQAYSYLDYYDIPKNIKSAVTVSDDTTESIVFDTTLNDDALTRGRYNTISFRLYNSTSSAHTDRLTVAINDNDAIQMPHNLTAKEFIYVTLLCMPYTIIMLSRYGSKGEISVNYIPTTTYYGNINQITIGYVGGTIPKDTVLREVYGARWLYSGD